MNGKPMLHCVACAALLVSLLTAGGCGHPVPEAGYPTYAAAKVRHDAAVDRIESLGGRVEYHKHGTAVYLVLKADQRFDDAVALLSNIIDLDSATLDTAGDTHWDLARLAKLQLRKLTLTRGHLGAVGTPPPVTKLASLNLIDTGATDSDIAALIRYGNLAELSISYSPVTIDGLAALIPLKHLRTVRLLGTSINERQATELMGNSPFDIELVEDDIAKP